MRVCPICDREFDDSKSLCPDDNSLLLCIIPDTEMMDTEQVVINKKTKPKKNHTKSKFVVPAFLIIIFTGIVSWLILSGFTNAFDKPYEESAIDSILNEPDDSTSNSDMNEVVNVDSSIAQKQNDSEINKKILGTWNFTDYDNEINVGAIYTTNITFQSNNTFIKSVKTISPANDLVPREMRYVTTTEGQYNVSGSKITTNCTKIKITGIDADWDYSDQCVSEYFCFISKEGHWKLAGFVEEPDYSLDDETLLLDANWVLTK